MPKSNYSYSSNDESLSTPFLYKFFVDPLITILPYRLPANFITLFSFLFLVAAFLIAVRSYYTGRYDYWGLIPVFVFCYLIGDCSDGKQARRTGTGSPLGEYFDHFLDSFVTGLLMGILMISFRITNPVIITIGFFSLYFGQIGMLWERYKRRVMQFGRISTSEGILAIAFSSWLMSFPSIYRLTGTKAVLNVNYREIIFIIIMIGTAVTAVKALIRAAQLSVRLVVHLVLSCTLIFVLASLYADNMVYITITVTFYNALFLAALLAATNLEKQEGQPDMLVPLSCVLFFIVPDYAVPIHYIQIVYLAVRILFRFAAFFRLHKHCWYWINPPKTAD